ncbi:hypothetical protein [Flavivirga spongiicola]|uniref:Uncharacterized protein n=1 Tax=Flavivirga spongiicola TaxID=421621 RepID=A0ABU7XX47_9FLAO|nr:hypothetical protein [Flavivirga sp. MEBiC05379]MDO5980025.1 hypothetical protein [Flavivirga sp. MEBiC05379]
MENKRREFLRTAGMGGLLFMSLPSMGPYNSGIVTFNDDLLLKTSSELLKQWGDTLLKYQINNKNLEVLYGGLMCPACARIHGRCPEAIYPLMYLASDTGEKVYLESAMALYEWMEKNVSQPDGSWVNDVNVSNWVGTTVFMAIALGEALMNHGELLGETVKQQWLQRLKKAADFINSNFHIGYSNINYPISAAYALSLSGDLYNNEAYKEHSKKLAHQALDYITPKNNLLLGERGKGNDQASSKGCYPVDLGYNVEESLPMLVMYGLRTKDTLVLDAVNKLLAAHMEFMLPDGAWDNSWGTRSFKWSYWGSRTSDGCQTAYGLLADKDPRFYKTALQNTQLLKACTHDGILYGGPHYKTHGVSPCIHHTFCHAKALATILDKGLPVKYDNIPDNMKLPRENPYGVKEMSDIGTWLISGEHWKATITGYDKEYSFKNGHPTGGALSMLWHKKMGPVLASSMNKYRLFETPNMQHNYDPNSTSLTARFQTVDGEFMNISDLKSNIEYRESEEKIEFTIESKLVDENQKSPESGEINAKLQYTFSEHSVKISAQHDSINEDKVHFVIPIISSSKEPFQQTSRTLLTVQKEGTALLIKTNKPIKILPTLKEKGRIFNHVPGMEAIPLVLKGNHVVVELQEN